MYLRQAWRDPRLSFTPINDKTKIRLHDGSWEEFWIPDTYFRNEKRAQFHKVTVRNRLLSLNATGHLWYVSRYGLVAVIGGLTNRLIRLQPTAGEFQETGTACNGGRESSIPAFGLQVCRNCFLTPIPSRSRVSIPIIIPVPNPTYCSFNCRHIFESHTLLQGQRLGPEHHTTTQHSLRP